jgi:nucleoside-diphosphate-sugar epimerase
MRVLVTGASGFVGRPTCAELLARGHDVMALVRRPGSEPEGTRAVRGDLVDAERLRAALAEAEPECVIHLAAENGAQRNAERIREVNVEGTRRLLDACAATSRPRFVFASTVVTGDARGALLEEDSPLPVETAYGRSKQEGERLVRESGLEASVVRISHVYGPGGWYAEDIVARIRQPGRFALVGSGGNMWDVVHVDDVARALADIAERAPAGSTYHVVDDTPIRYGDFMRLTAKALGVGPPRRVPVFAARLAAGRDPVAAVLRSARSSNARIKRELGWEPRFASAEAGVPDAIARLDGARA